ncbi:MAG TPA: Uma2 family endonuclease [Longimicrobium sp.]|nr:Uma2 family endonuclease [Longimicrobium sp.]
MATHPAVRDWTYAEFARLPDDGNRYEVIAGELEVTPSPRPKHQDLVGALAALLRPFVRRHELGKIYPGPIDVLFAEGDYLVPDLVFVRSEQLGTVTDRGVESAPDLVVEVLSPSTALRDRTVKRRRYALYGVPELWLIDSDRRLVEVYRLQKDAHQPAVVTGRVRWQPVQNGPCLDLEMAELFADVG